MSGPATPSTCVTAQWWWSPHSPSSRGARPRCASPRDRRVGYARALCAGTPDTWRCRSCANVATAEVAGAAALESLTDQARAGKNRRRDQARARQANRLFSDERIRSRTYKLLRDLSNAKLDRETAQLAATRILRDGDSAPRQELATASHSSLPPRLVSASGSARRWYAVSAHRDVSEARGDTENTPGSSPIHPSASRRHGRAAGPAVARATSMRAARREARRRAQFARRRAYRAAGRCACGHEPEPGKLLCRDCALQNAAQYARMRRDTPQFWNTRDARRRSSSKRRPSADH